MQWRYKCSEPPGDARPDLDIMNDLMVRVRELYLADITAPNREAILDLTWGYGGYGAEVDPRAVAREVNGYFTGGGGQVPSFVDLEADGSTASGNWLYCGSYVNPEDEPDAPVPGNRASRRSLDDAPYNIGLFSKWGWCWPVNRRIIYNRASVDLNGVPWDQEQPVLWWVEGEWTGDVPDGGDPPMAEGGYYPFIMKSPGHAFIFGGVVGPRENSLADGPFPEHYEPWESPLGVNPLSGTKNDPVVVIWHPQEQAFPNEFPIVATTYRVCEHWQAGQMTRNLPWLVEQMPNMFVELSEELAASRGIANGDRVTVENKRGTVEAVAVVTRRFRPFQLNGKTVHQIGMVWHWGYTGLSTGDSANVLTPTIGDPNTTIPEYKAFLCDIRRA
jgi:formate dehydrogenase major subunit